MRHQQKKQSYTFEFTAFELLMLLWKKIQTTNLPFQQALRLLAWSWRKEQLRKQTIFFLISTQIYYPKSSPHFQLPESDVKMNISIQILFQVYEGSEGADIAVKMIRNQLQNLFRSLTRGHDLLITTLRWRSRKKIKTCMGTKNPQDEHVARHLFRC